MRRTLAIWLLIAEFVLAWVGLGVITSTIPVLDSLGQLALWVGLALAYLAVGGIVMWRAAVAADGGEEPHLDEEPLERFAVVIPYITSAVGVAVAVYTTLVKAHPDAAYRVTYQILGGVAMLESWAVLHSGLARQYYHWWRHEGGLEFPRTERPGYADFVYFSFTLGASFAVSDVQVTSRRMRLRVVVHAAWSFVYNAAVVAMAISLLTGR